MSKIMDVCVWVPQEYETSLRTHWALEAIYKEKTDKDLGFHRESRQFIDRRE